MSSEGNLSLGLDVKPQQGLADSGDLELDVVSLLSELGRAAADAGRGVVFLLDELQLAVRAELEGLVAALHMAAQEQFPVALVGAGLPTLPGKVLDAKTYAERLFRFPELGPLNDEAAREALVAPASDLGVEFRPDAVERILTESEGYPYFIQEWGRAAWNAARGSVIDATALDRAASVVGHELDEDFFGMRTERMTPAELKYCHALAGLGDGPHPSGEVAKAIGRDPRSLSVVRSRLIDKGLVYAAGRGSVAFTVPHFARYLTRSAASE